jgi:hypothetical protein
MNRRYYIGLVGTLVLMGLFLTTSITQARSNNCQHIDGHIDGQVISLSPLCETGTFTDSDGNILGGFSACATGIGLEEEGEGAFKLQLMHTYSSIANQDDTFRTADNIVLSPIDPPLYGVNNRAIVTGGTGVYQGASGFIEDHGTFNSGIVSVDYHGLICTP